MKRWRWQGGLRGLFFALHSNVGIKGDHNRVAVEGRPLNDLLGLTNSQAETIKKYEQTQDGDHINAKTMW